MSDGRGSVSALVRAAVASADASTLKVLDLSFNALVSLDDDDGTPVASGGCFASLPALEDLRVGDNELTTLKSSNLERVGDRLRSLRAQNNALRSLTGLEKMRALETLRVDGNPSLGDGSDGSSRGPDRGLSRVTLASLPSALTSLNLSRCNLKSLDGFQNAAAARRLEELRVDGNRFEAPDVFAPLKNCARLVELHVADARLTPACLAGLRALAPTLETLVLDGNPGLAEPGARERETSALAKKRLDADAKKKKEPLSTRDARSSAREDDAKVLALHRAPRLPALTCLSVSRCGARALGPSGWSLADVAPALERLDASRNAVADAAGLGAATTLRRLKEVVLAGNPMCRRGVRLFSPGEDASGDDEVSFQKLTGWSRLRDDREDEDARGETTERANELDAYLRAVTAALPGVAFVDDVAVGKKDDDDSDDVSDVSDVSGFADLDVDARDVVRVRDGAVRLGTETGTETGTGTATGTDRNAVHEEGSEKAEKKAVAPASPSAVVSAFRSAMLAHDSEMRASLARVRAALAAPPAEAAAALRRDGTFLAEGRDVPSRTLPPAPRLGTVAPAARLGDAKDAKRRASHSAARKDGDERWVASRETRGDRRASVAATRSLGEENGEKAQSSREPASAVGISSAARSVAALKARRRGASAVK